MVFLTSCAACNQPGEVLCSGCRFALVTSPAVRTEHGVDAAAAFDGVARQAVLALKFRNRRAVAGQLAALMVRRLVLPGASRRGGSPFDLVTWAPTSAARSSERGFDQAELLARAVARKLGVPCRRLLYRSHGPSQTGRRRSDRLHSPSFRARSPRPGLRVLLVDDVVTTGSTLLAAQSALLDAGIAAVRCIAAAATVDRSVAANRSGRPAA